MKRITSLFVCLGFSVIGIAQNVGIGTNSPNASALLDLQSTNKGLLLPRVADTNAVASPAKGLVIYSTNANALFYYNGSNWQSTANSGSGDLWYKYQDSVLVTDKEYVSINPSPNVQTPMSGLSVNGNLVVQPKLLASKANPTVAQALTMNNTSSLQSSLQGDSVGRLFDPGGQNVNYFNNMQGNYFINPTSVSAESGIILNFNPSDFGLAVGDTLWVSRYLYPDCRIDYELMLTNTTTPPSTINLSGSGATIIFRSNGDGLNAKGFDISWKKVFNDNSVTNIPSAGFGNALVFNTQDGSFRTGSPLRNIGSGAACIGCNVANGKNSFATFGGYANGDNSIALNAFARGNSSVAIAGGQANGDNSFSSGINSNALGDYSTALGTGSRAKGFTAVAIGGGLADGTRAIAVGDATRALSYKSIALGSFNDTLTGTSETNWVPTDPLIYIGNGNFTKSNAMVIYKNANVDINGYTRLGKLSEGAPEIKMKKFTGISSSSQNGFTDITHGLSRTKIIGVQVIMKLPGFVDLGPGSRVNSGYEYEFQILDNIIRIANLNGNSANILNKNFVVLVTYEE